MDYSRGAWWRRRASEGDYCHKHGPDADQMRRLVDLYSRHNTQWRKVGTASVLIFHLALLKLVTMEDNKYLASMIRQRTN